VSTQLVTKESHHKQRLSPDGTLVEFLALPMSSGTDLPHSRPRCLLESLFRFTANPILIHLNRWLHQQRKTSRSPSELLRDRFRAGLPRLRDGQCGRLSGPAQTPRWARDQQGSFACHWHSRGRRTARLRSHSHTTSWPKHGNPSDARVSKLGRDGSGCGSPGTKRSLRIGPNRSLAARISAALARQRRA
jgi:hypothetical protein